VEGSGVFYRVSQEERLIFWEVTVTVILSKKVYIYIYSDIAAFRKPFLIEHNAYTKFLIE
jgi:hypothetical protein